MSQKILGSDFTDDASPSGSYYVSAWNGSSVVDILLSNLHKALTAATQAVAGVIEIATVSELDAGTDTGRAVTPDVLAGSIFGEKSVGIVVFQADEAVAVGDGVFGIPVPASLNGMNIVDVLATVEDQGVTGTTDVQIRRRRSGSDVDVLSTKITIGAEYYANDGVVNSSNDDLATGDVLYVDVDAVHSGTAPNGLSVVITARLP